MISISHALYSGYNFHSSFFSLVWLSILFITACCYCYNFFVTIQSHCVDTPLSHLCIVNFIKFTCWIMSFDRIHHHPLPSETVLASAKRNHRHKGEQKNRLKIWLQSLRTHDDHYCWLLWNEKTTIELSLCARILVNSLRALSAGCIQSARGSSAQSSGPCLKVHKVVFFFYRLRTQLQTLAFRSGEHASSSMHTCRCRS